MGAASPEKMSTVPDDICNCSKNVITIEVNVKGKRAFTNNSSLQAAILFNYI